jgi:hypothetical protein
MIDSLELFESLKTANLSEPQALAIAQAIGKAFEDNDTRQAKALANKADTAKLDAEMHQVETSLKHDISNLGVELRADISNLGVELRAEMRALAAQLRSEMSQLETKIAESKSAMIRWMFIFWIGQVAAMKFLK